MAYLKARTVRLRGEGAEAVDAVDAAETSRVESRGEPRRRVLVARADDALLDAERELAVEHHVGEQVGLHVEEAAGLELRSG